MKRYAKNTQIPPTLDLVITKQKTPLVSKSVVENKSDNNKKNSIEPDMGYEIIEDIKKTKANVSLFDMCNLPQQRRKLLESFDPQPDNNSKAIESDTEINEASIGGKSKSQTLPFLLGI